MSNLKKTVYFNRFDLAYYGIGTYKGEYRYRDLVDDSIMNLCMESDLFHVSQKTIKLIAAIKLSILDCQKIESSNPWYTLRVDVDSTDLAAAVTYLSYRIIRKDFGNVNEDNIKTALDHVANAVSDIIERDIIHHEKIREKRENDLFHVETVLPKELYNGVHAGSHTEFCNAALTKLIHKLHKRSVEDKIKRVVDIVAARKLLIEYIESKAKVDYDKDFVVKLGKSDFEDVLSTYNDIVINLERNREMGMDQLAEKNIKRYTKEAKAVVNTLQRILDDPEVMQRIINE